MERVEVDPLVAGGSVYAATATPQRQGVLAHNLLDTRRVDRLRSTPSIVILSAPRPLAVPCAKELTPLSALTGPPDSSVRIRSNRNESTLVCSSTTIHGDGSGFVNLQRLATHSATPQLQQKLNTLAGELTSKPLRDALEIWQLAISTTFMDTSMSMDTTVRIKKDQHYKVLRKVFSSRPLAPSTAREGHEPGDPS